MGLLMLFRIAFWWTLPLVIALTKDKQANEYECSEVKRIAEDNSNMKTCECKPKKDAGHQ